MAGGFLCLEAGGGCPGTTVVSEPASTIFSTPSALATSCPSQTSAVVTPSASTLTRKRVPRTLTTVAGVSTS